MNFRKLLIRSSSDNIYVPFSFTGLQTYTLFHTITLSFSIFSFFSMLHHLLLFKYIELFFFFFLSVHHEQTENSGYLLQLFPAAFLLDFSASSALGIYKYIEEKAEAEHLPPLAPGLSVLNA